MAISTRTRKPRRAEAQLAFEALYIEGGLLAPEWLTKVARLGASAQSEADYRVLKGLNLRDEIGRYWRVAQAHWGEFASGRTSGADPKALAERFVLALLRDAFGFGSLAVVGPAVIAERTYPIGHAALGGRVPVVIAPAGSGLDALPTSAGDGVRRRSAFGLAQEYLNAEDGALWGVVSDGVTLRILRDNASLTRPAWIEADLGRIFTEERYADFAALWLLTHETRFGKPDQPVAECALEAWRNAGREEGTRAREHLRRGVEDALAALGHGFVSHPDNASLRASLQEGSLKERDFFNQLLRLVYRLIFLLTVEERGLLHPEGTPEALQRLYADGYSLRRLRERSAKRSAHDRHSDVWDAVKIVFRGVAAGEPRLGLPALAGIFAKSQCPALDAAKLENRALLLAVFKLSWLRDAAGLSRVNWRDMGPEELGSVYESLLELVPVVSVATRSFAFATGDETKGNARKTSGSYYTPDSLVQVLLDSTLEPVVKQTIAAHPINPIDALLSLSIVDPACGSGHFLLAAARRLAAHVARLQTDGTPSAAEYRHALRQVVGRCIYGVDLNPMAIELCKVALWMEAVEPGLPLTFLDAHIQHGNALLGATPELMEKGIPNAAWELTDGDDRKVASALKKRNAKETTGQTTMTSLWSQPAASGSQEVTRAIAALEAVSDADVSSLAAKESCWADILASGVYRHQRFVADTWCAAFVWPKPGGGGSVVDAAPTMGLWRDIRDGKGQPPALTVTTVEILAAQYRFFHWHLAFPTVFAKGGFDVILGNPPWEMPETDDRVVLAAVAPELAHELSPQVRREALDRLMVTDPVAWERWSETVRANAGFRSILSRCGRFPAAGIGRLNLCRAFIEHNHTLISPLGRAGMVVQSGMWSAEYERPLWHKLLDARSLVSVLDFENSAGLFPGVHRSARFALLTLAGEVVPAFMVGFWLRDPNELRLTANRLLKLSTDDLSALDPDTRALPQFRNERDLGILLSLVRRLSPLGKHAELPHTPRLMFSSSDACFNVISNDEAAALPILPNGRRVKGDSELLPVFEGKMVGVFDHRQADIVINRTNLARPAQERPISDFEKANPLRFACPQYWIPVLSVRQRRFGESTGQGDWELAFCDVTAATNERTSVAAIVPLAGLNRSLPAIYLAQPCASVAAQLVGIMGAFVFDYLVRLRVTGNHFTQGILATIPVPALNARADLGGGFVVPRVLELSYTAWDLESFAHDVGYAGPPFRWDPVRRSILRAELDAAFFHRYGLSRNDADYILDSFPGVRKNDVKAHGEYRTKRVILEIYDAMTEAARTGVPYVTRLDPPPADPRVAHPQRSASAEAAR